MVGEDGAVRPAEAHGVTGVPGGLDGVATLMYRPMMDATEKGKVAQAGLSTGGPVANVMAVHEATVGASRETTASVASLERPTNSRRDGPSLAADVEGRTSLVLHNADHRGVTGQPTRGLGGQGGAILQLATTLDVHGQYLGVDVHRHQVAISAMTRLRPPGQEGFGHHHQGVCSALSGGVGIGTCGQRFRGTFVHSLLGGIHRLAHDRTLLWSEPGVEHQTAVVVMEPLHVPSFVQLIYRVDLILA